MAVAGTPNSAGGPFAPPPPDLTPRDWKLYVLPLVVFLLITTLEPAPEQPADQRPAPIEQALASDTLESALPPAGSEPTIRAEQGLAAEEPRPGSQTSAAAPPQPWKVSYAWYPAVYTLKVVVLLGMIAWFWPGYRSFGPRVSPTAVIVGAVGVVIWVALVDLERTGLGGLSPSARLGMGARTAYNPLEQLADRPLEAWGFLAVRWVGLVLVVPLIEEFFLRGFLMRYFARPDWWQVPPGQWDPAGVASVTGAAVAMHPAEILAALAWFSLISAMYLRTRNLWDCVVAHAVTNLLLGAYVLATGSWYLM